MIEDMKGFLEYLAINKMNVFNVFVGVAGILVFIWQFMFLIVAWFILLSLYTGMNNLLTNSQTSFDEYNSRLFNNLESLLTDQSNQN